VGIDDLIADFVQALLLFPGPKKAAMTACGTSILYRNPA
jgi:hypothetical protein